MIKIISFALSILILLGTISGCTYAPSKPRIESVVVLEKSPPNTCQFIKQISVYDVNGSTIMYSSDKKIDSNQMRELQKEALALGANYIYLIQKQKTYKTRLMGTFLDRQRMTGNTYRCPNLSNKIEYPLN